MKKDIPIKKVEDVAIAILPREDENGEIDETLWNVYLINMKPEGLEGVLINSRGYGELEGEEKKTTVLRHFFEKILPTSATLIEPIQAKVFDLANEYWISFRYQDYMYDKKYVFVKGSIDRMNFTNIPYIEKMGVMIK
jgi:hypothetical protein